MKLRYEFVIVVQNFIFRPDGNPMGYKRTTQKSKRFDKNAILYEQWKDHVWKEFLRYYPKFEPSPEKTKIFLKTNIFYKNDTKSDPSNVHKGIEDALADKKVNIGGKMRVLEQRMYANDNLCAGSFDFDYDKTNPHVVCEIYW